MKLNSLEVKLIMGSVVASLLTACSTGGTTDKPAAPSQPQDQQAISAAPSEVKPAKHDCKGKNACKGQGNCSSGDNGCKGRNNCKGHGGCRTDGGPVPAETKAADQKDKKEKNSCGGPNGCGSKEKR